MDELSSYGYFFNGNDPQNGQYLLLPNGHNAEDRIAAQRGAGTDYEYCALFYSSDGETFVPFSKRDDDPITLVIDKNSRFAFWMNYSTFVVEPIIEHVTHFNNPFGYDSIWEHIDFNKAKAWLKANYGNIDIVLVNEDGNSYFRVGVQTSVNHRYDVVNPDLVVAIIQLYQELNA